MKSKLFPIFAVSRSAILVAASSSIAFAADGTWTSVASSGNWVDAGNWDLGNIADGSGATANFTSDITGTTTVTNDGRTIGNLVFSDNGAAGSAWAITGSTLTSAGGSTITTITDATIRSILAGTGFTKTGVGTLILSNTSNSFSGGVNLAGGTLQISAASNLPSGNALTFTGGTLNITSAITLANNVTIASGQSGTIKAPTFGLVTLTGSYTGVAGTLTLDLTASNSYGGIAVGSGAANAGPTTGSIVNVLGTTGANNTQIDMRPTNAVTFFKDSKVVITASGGGQTLFGLGNAGNGRNYQFGALDGGNATTQIQSDNASSTLTINGVTSGNYSGVITNGSGGSIALVKTGSATQTLSGTNTYTGTTTISGGTLAISTAANLSTSSGLIFTGGTLNTTAGMTLANNVTIASGQSGTIKVANAATILSGNYTGMVGTLTLDMSAVSGFAGITAVSANNGPAGTVNVIGGTGSNQSQLGGAGGTFWANTILTFGSGNVYLNGTTTSWTFGALSGGSVGAGTLGTMIGFDNNSGKTVTINGIADANFGGVIFNGSGSSGANNLVKSGSSTQTFTGTNTYTGTTTLKNGVVQLAGGSGRLSASTALTIGDVATTGKLVLGSTGLSGVTDAKSDQTVAGLISTGLGGSVVGGYSAVSTLTVNNAGGNVFAGTLGGAGTNENNLALTKTGAGTLTLSGTNTYTGATTVNAGKLLVNGSTAGGSAVSVSAGTATGTPLATLGGIGTVGGSVSLAAQSAGGFNNGGVLAPTASANGVALSVTGTTTFNTGSIFEWDMSATAPATDPGVVSNSGSYGQLAGTGTIGGSGAVFKIVLGSGNAFTDAFWDTNKTWTNVFSGSGTTVSLASIFSSFGGSGGISSAGLVAGQGQFTFNGGTTLNWSAVPETSTAFAGLLIGAGLLRRRRKN
ncbi:MAG: autotransporter-associated beta strand repeat-containing protein [Luteolibacter sp.]